jgi:hypothetical protein
MRLRVKIKNAKECRTELIFPDLSVKYNNGYSLPIKVAEGAEIPLDVLDQEDVRKSLKIGSLKGYLDNGWIEEIFGDIVDPIQSPSLSHFITEQMVLAPKAPTKVVEAKLPEIKEVPTKPNLPEEVKVVEQNQVSIPITEPITDLNIVKSYEDFNRLSHFLKIRFIKETNDIALLKDISSKTASIQFKNNINLRLTQIKI